MASKKLTFEHHTHQLLSTQFEGKMGRNKRESDRQADRQKDRRIYRHSQKKQTEKWITNLDLQKKLNFSLG